MMKRFHPTVTKVIRLIVVVSLGGLFPTAAVGQTIVWTDVDARRIQGKGVNGAEVQTMVQFVSGPAATQISYDPVTAKLYYLFGTSFQRANLDGSAPENIPTPSTGFFTLNIELRKLHWTVGFNNVLNRSELDGSGAQSHTYPICCLIPLLALGDELFLAGSLGRTKGIWRADADGSNEQLLHESGMPTGAAYDPVEDKLYWFAFPEGIHRMNRDGTGFETILFNPFSGGSEKIVVDVQGRKLYWTDLSDKVIRRSDFDGSNVEDFVTATDAGNTELDLRGLTIVYNTTPIPALSDWGLVTAALAIVAAGLLVLKRRVRTAHKLESPAKGEATEC